MPPVAPWAADVTAGALLGPRGDLADNVDHAERERLRHRLTILDGWGLATQALSDGDVEQLSRLAEQMQHMPLDDDTMWQQHQLAPFGMAWRMAGNFPPMVAALQESLKMTRMAQNRYLEAQILWGLIVALIALGQVALRRGDLAGARALHCRGLLVLRDAGGAHSCQVRRRIREGLAWTTGHARRVA